jgi:hypothetical protein
MKVTMPSGETYEGATADDVVCKMSQSEWSPMRLMLYVRKVAEGVQAATGREINADDALHFLFDLEQVGVIQSVEYLTTDEARQFNEWQQSEWEPDDQPHGDSNDDNEA